MLGSNRPQRICMPKREWDAIREASRDNLDRLGRGTPEGLPDTSPAGR